MSALAEEIVICGAGPAGMAAAIRLRQAGFDPLVLDKGSFPRGKLCGEFLGPDAFDCLKTLGVWEAIRRQSAGPVAEARFHLMDGRCLRVPLRWMSRRHPYGLGVSREVLDAELVRQGRQLGIRVMEKVRVLPEVRFEGGVFRLRRILADGTRQNLSARLVVDAAGRHGGLHLSGQPADEALRDLERLGLQRHIRLAEAPDPSVLSMFFFPGGYGGIQPLHDFHENRLANLCMYAPAETARHAREGLPQLLENTMGHNPVAARLLDGAESAGPLRTTARINLKCRPSGLIRLGDAMITVDPVTGSGMALALQTGLMAAGIIADGWRRGWDQARIRRAYDHAFHRHLSLRLAVLGWLRPLLFSPGIQHRVLPLARPALPLLTAVLR